MKRIRSNILLYIAILFCNVVSVSAQVNETDISTLDYAIYASPSSVMKGGQATLSIKLKNINAISTWQADLVLPTGVSISKDEVGDDRIFLSTARTSASCHSIGWNAQGDGSVRLLCSSNTNRTFSGTDGEVATIVLDVEESLSIDTYAITFKNILMVEPNQNSHSLDQVVSTLQVTPHTYKIVATSQNDYYGSVTIDAASYNASTHEVNADDQVTITAIANNRYKFSQWTINGSSYSASNPLTFSANADLSVVAVFEAAQVSSHLLKSTVVTKSVVASGNMWKHNLTANLYNYTSSTINPSSVVLREKDSNVVLDSYAINGLSVASNSSLQFEFEYQSSSKDIVNAGEESGIFGVDFYYTENGKDVYVASENNTIEIVTIQATDQIIVYDGKTHAIEYSCFAEGVFDGDVQTRIERIDSNTTSEVSAFEVKNTGTYKFTFSIDKFGFSGSKTALLTIDKALLSVSADNKTKVYGEDNPVFTYAMSGFVNDEPQSVLATSPTATCSATKYSDVGTYDITVSGGSSENYGFSYSKGTLTVTKATQTISWNQSFGTLKEGDQVELTAFASSGESVSYESSDTQIAQIYSSGGTMMLNCKQNGTVTITAKQTGSINYNDATPVTKTITIEKSVSYIVINVGDATMYYDGFSHDLNFTLSSSEVSPTDIIVEIAKVDGGNETPVSGNQVKDAGKYHFYYTINKDNYKGSANAFLTIEQTTLIVTAEDKTKTYGEEIPELTYVISGFVNNENEDQLLGKPIASTMAGKFSDVGDYTISVDGASATNYLFIYIKGKLTVTKADQEIVWNQIIAEMEVENTVILEAYSTSGLEIDYSLSNANATIEYVDGIPLLKCLSPGIVTVYAMQNGNNNYNAAGTQKKTITIKESSSIGNVHEDNLNNSIYYDILGNRVSSKHQGFIITNSKGKSSIVLVK